MKNISNSQILIYDFILSILYTIICIKYYLKTKEPL